MLIGSGNCLIATLKAKQWRLYYLLLLHVLPSLTMMQLETWPPVTQWKWKNGRLKKQPSLSLFLKQISLSTLLQRLCLPCMFRQLPKTADEIIQGNHPTCKPEDLFHIRLILDEFANFGRFPNFTETLSSVRSREISIAIIIQAISNWRHSIKTNGRLYSITVLPWFTWGRMIRKQWTISQCEAVSRLSMLRISRKQEERKGQAVSLFRPFSVTFSHLMRWLVLGLMKP